MPTRLPASLSLFLKMVADGTAQLASTTIFIRSGMPDRDRQVPEVMPPVRGHDPVQTAAVIRVHLLRQFERKSKCIIKLERVCSVYNRCV